jgi:peptidoglycan hydrolase-like protein with peptidoglycan-binding domain
MRLKLGDFGEHVKRLQRALNRIGSLLLIDGEFGPGTQAAVVEACAFVKRPVASQADDELIALLEMRPEPSPELTTPGVVFIGREEVSSPAAYRAKYRRPVWPPPPSGITIGIGYDLQFVTRAQFDEDWASVLPPATRARFLPTIGVTGSQALVDAVRDVDIPLPAAVDVFLRRMVPTHAARARSIYPSLDRLPPARRTALISLVFNRGSDLSGDRRREMKQIQSLLADGSEAAVDAVADEIESMTRLWSPDTAPGLITRRRREAQLWRAGFSALRLV